MSKTSHPWRVAFIDGILRSAEAGREIVLEEQPVQAEGTMSMVQ